MTKEASPNSPRDISEQSEIAELPPFLRVLLTTDGTVTSSLQAYFWEKVAVDALDQSLQVLESPFEALALQQGDEVLHRQVQLRGENTGNIYARASSLICMDLLSPSIKEAIVAKQIGVGELLRDCGLETYRQILSSGVNFGESKNATREIPNTGSSGKREAWRSYLIVMDQHPFIHITEHFPLDLFESSDHSKK